MSSRLKRQQTDVVYEGDHSKLTWTEWIVTERASNFISCYIIFNCLVIGIEADNRDEDTPFDPIGWYLLDNVTVFVFTAESYLKIRALGRDYFHSTWNLFDFFLVWYGLIDTYFLSVIAGTKLASQLKHLKVLRMLR